MKLEREALPSRAPTQATLAGPAHNHVVRSFLAELSGALGDLGTMAPLAVGLIVINGMNPTTLFLVAGCAYIFSGLYYRIPMPVQPLKAVAAAAIAAGVGPSVISGAGMIMGVLLLFLALTGLILPVARLFPKCVVRGIQLGLALMLLKTAWGLTVVDPKLLSPLAAWGLLLAGIALGLLCFRRSWPASLVIIGFGLLVAAASGWFADLGGAGPGPLPVSLGVPDVGQLGLALVLLVIPQIPMTIGNAVIATRDAAATYYGDKARKVTLRALCGSMGLANLAAGFLGGMPVCHGSGGVSAHYRFGARTWAAPVMMGVICLAMALLAGRSLVPVLSLVPLPVLAVLLMFTAVQHGLLVRDLRARLDWVVAGLVGAVTIATGNLALGFAAGLAVYYAARGLARFWSKRETA